MGRHRAAPPLAQDAGRRGLVLRGGTAERLTVVALAVVLLAVVALGLRGVHGRAARMACDADVAQVALAVEAWTARHRALPATSADLVSAGYLAALPSAHTVAYVPGADGRTFSVTGRTSSGETCRTVTSG